MEVAGETVYGSLVVSHMKNLATIVSLQAARISNRPSTTTLNRKNAWKPAQAVPNVVELSGMLRDGKDQDVTILILALWMTELSKVLQREDGEMPNAMLELVSTQSEVDEG